MRIERIETRRYEVPLDPPFRAAWDPVPRDRLRETIVLVHADDGNVGVASGAPLPDGELLSRLLVGVDPRRTETVRGICESVDFHGGRPWAVEVAVWDLVGHVLGEPLWRLLGGRSDALLAYASSGERVSADERVRRVKAMVADGIRAVKIRFHHDDWQEDVEVVEAVREAVGSAIEIMVDANQGWRMPGDLRTPWDASRATACARALERSDVYWLEEPLPTSDVDGYASLRRRTSVRLAAGEMIRSLAESRDLLLRGGIDIVQPDVVLAGGFGGCRRLADLAELAGRAFSPHTWTNGLGMIANLHLAMAVSTVPFVEVPFDPPAWSAERRDWLLPESVPIAPDGTIRPPSGPGLGIVLDLDELEGYRVA
jgi:L-alanine-DL-glutamate epimerase-like enolase superfamily enzyme